MASRGFQVQDVLVALCLVLVIEGLMPAVAPKLWRETLLKLTQNNDRTLRVIGLIAMIVGAAILYISKP